MPPTTHQADTGSLVGLGSPTPTPLGWVSHGGCRAPWTRRQLLCGSPEPEPELSSSWGPCTGPRDQRLATGPSTCRGGKPHCLSAPRHPCQESPLLTQQAPHDGDSQPTQARGPQHGPSPGPFGSAPPSTGPAGTAPLPGSCCSRGLQRGLPGHPGWPSLRPRWQRPNSGCNREITGAELDTPRNLQKRG